METLNNNSKHCILQMTNRPGKQLNYVGVQKNGKMNYNQNVGLEFKFEENASRQVKFGETQGMG